MSTQPHLFPMPQTSATTDDYWTPAWLFEALGVEFDVDVACPPEGPPHTPCKTFFTQETDGLASEWIGNVWMNPPYGKVTPWALKFMDHAHGICLVPFTKSKWFDAIWADCPAMLPMPSNMKFDQGGIYMPTVLFAYGEENIQALHNSKIGRVR